MNLATRHVQFTKTVGDCTIVITFDELPGSAKEKVA